MTAENKAEERVTADRSNSQTISVNGTKKDMARVLLTIQKQERKANVAQQRNEGIKIIRRLYGSRVPSNNAQE